MSTLFTPQQQAQHDAGMDRLVKTVADRVKAQMGAELSASMAQRQATADSAKMDRCRKALLLAVQGVFTSRVAQETRKAIEAATRPDTFLSWHREFYPRFTSQLSASLDIWKQAADSVGIVLDSTALAMQHSVQSMADLESLADLPCGQLAGAVRRLTDSWSDRPATIANSLSPNGSDLS